MATKDVNERLESLRQALREERISYGELHELQSLADQIDPGDGELLAAAGVPEFPDDQETEWWKLTFLVAMPPGSSAEEANDAKADEPDEAVKFEP